jgi:glycosyltransferase involved in cell wall biosynthesis
MERTKVIHVAEDLMVGGIERIIATIATALDPAKYDVEVWCIVRGGPVADEIRSRGLPVVILDIRSYHNPLSMMRFIRTLRKAHPAIVHVHGYFAATAGRIAALAAGVPATINHYHTIYYNMTFFNRVINNYLDRRSGRTIYISEAVRASFVPHCYVRPDSVVMYNGVDTDLYSPGVFDATRQIITCVGSLTAQKGHVFLLSAFKIVLARHPGAQLWIAGEGPLRETLTSEAARLGISDSLQLLGRRDDVASILRRSGIFVMSSLREGLPVALIEAMACALPVVATDVGGMPELVADRESGFIIPAKNPEALAAAMIRLLDDPHKAREMGLRGNAVFKNKFTSVSMKRTLEAIYDELLKNKKRP